MGFCIRSSGKKKKNEVDILPAVVVDKRGTDPPRNIPETSPFERPAKLNKNENLFKTKELKEQPIPKNYDPLFAPYPNKDSELKHQEIAERLTSPLTPANPERRKSSSVLFPLMPPPRKHSTKDAQTENLGKEEKETQTEDENEHFIPVPLPPPVTSTPLATPSIPRPRSVSSIPAHTPSINTSADDDIPEITHKAEEMKEIPLQDVMEKTKKSPPYPDPPYPVPNPPYPLDDKLPKNTVHDAPIEKDPVLDSSLDEEEFKEKVRGKESMPGRNHKGPRKELLV